MAHVYYLVFNNSYDETIKPFEFVNREEQVLSFYPLQMLDSRSQEVGQV